MRTELARVQKLSYKENQQAWFLEAIHRYCDAVATFANDLSANDLASSGLIDFRDYLTAYVGRGRFIALVSATKSLKAQLATVQYSVLIHGDRFTVRKYEAEPDYSVAVEATFEKFKQGAVRDYQVTFKPSDDMNHIEAKILEFVAKLRPDVFQALDRYCADNVDFIDPTIAAFDREIQFYCAYLDYIAPLKKAGLSFCYPRVRIDTKEIYEDDGFDIALAQKLIHQSGRVVCNDFFLNGKERILVVSGPNQGGKTTFARTFGQLHYLASLGYPVPGSGAQLFLFDRIFTHFEREEKIDTLRGKLEDDLFRIRKVLDAATSRSIIIMNEIFTSTTVQDEVFLSQRIVEKITTLDALCVWVTFVDELASFGPQTVSMVSTVVPDNPAERTFKIERRPADGLAYAMAIARKYRLTYDSIKDRMGS